MTKRKIVVKLLKPLNCCGSKVVVWDGFNFICCCNKTQTAKVEKQLKGEE